MSDGSCRKSEELRGGERGLVREGSGTALFPSHVCKDTFSQMSEDRAGFRFSDRDVHEPLF